MKSIMNLVSVAKEAVNAVTVMDDTSRKVLPEEIADLVNFRAKLAVASAWIPIGGLDIAAATANVWTMYFKINKMLDLKFSENKVKTIASAVISNLVQNIATVAVAAGLKYIPGIGPFAAAGIMSAALYVLTQTSGWIYLKAISTMALNDGDISLSVKNILKDKDMINEFAKQNQKK